MISTFELGSNAQLVAEITLKLLIGGLAPFIGLLSGFVAVSIYLGGGPLGVALAILLSAAYLCVYGGYLHISDTRKMKPESASTDNTKESKMGLRDTELPPTEASPKEQESGGASIFTRDVQPAPARKRTPRKPRAVRQPQFDAEDVCPVGPYEVEAGAPVKIELDVVEGQMIKGLLEEADGYDFDWLIVDEDDWVNFRQTRRYHAEAEGSDEATYKVEWIVSGEGPWFLILDAYGRQYCREVGVCLGHEGWGIVRSRKGLAGNWDLSSVPNSVGSDPHGFEFGPA